MKLEAIMQRLDGMEGGEWVWKLTSSMNTTNVHGEAGAALAVTGNPYQGTPAAR